MCIYKNKWIQWKKKKSACTNLSFHPPPYLLFFLQLIHLLSYLASDTGDPLSSCCPSGPAIWSAPRLPFPVLLFQFQKAWCPRSPAPRVSLAGGAAVCSSSSPLYCFLSQSLSPPNSQSIRSDVTLYIYLCVAARSVVKSRRLTCPLGKSMALLFTALGLLLLLLRQDRYNSFLFLSFLLALGPELFFWPLYVFFFFFPLLLNRISLLVIDSNVNRWKAFAKSQNSSFPQRACAQITPLPTSGLSVSVFLIFYPRAWLMTHLSTL